MEEKEFNGDIDRFVHEVRKNGLMNTDLPKVVSKNIKRGLVALLVGVPLWSSFYTVDKNQNALVSQFGKYISTEGPGIHFKVPLIQDVEKVNTTEIRRVTVGFQYDRSKDENVQIPIERLMLTGDQGIINMGLVAQFQVSDPKKFVYNCSDVMGTMKDASESAIRTVVGDSGFTDVLTVGKARIQDETRTRIREIVERYDCGDLVTEVKLQSVSPPNEVQMAYDDVINAKSDATKEVNDATGKASEIREAAKGQAAEIIASAKAYKTEVVDAANGEINRFLAMLNEYKVQPEITRRRMYIETMKGVLPDVDVTFIGKDVNRTGLVPLLSLGNNQSNIQYGGMKNEIKSN